MLALIDGVPIVTHEWVAALVQLTAVGAQMPKEEAYLPEISQGTTQSIDRADFVVNTHRRGMLQGHLFFFLSSRQVS
jgi:hypothetical protein